DSYREFLFAHDDPAISGFRGMDYETFSAEKRRAPFVRDLLAYWDGLYEEPFSGVTADGAVKEGLYALPEHSQPNDEGMVAAAERVLAVLDDEEREAFCYPLDAREWRAWSNPEFVIHRVGLRLENLGSDAVDAVMGLVRASLSPEGYERVRKAMALN